MSFLTTELVGEADGGSIDVDERGVRLPDVEALLLRLDNWSVKPEPADLSAANTTAVIYGFYGQLLHFLRADSATEYLIVPGRNLRNVILRTKPGETVTIFYSWQR
jgi:hypothetical protein